MSCRRLFLAAAGILALGCGGLGGDFAKAPAPTVVPATPDEVEPTTPANQLKPADVTKPADRAKPADPVPSKTPRTEVKTPATDTTPDDADAEPVELGRPLSTTGDLATKAPFEVVDKLIRRDPAIKACVNAYVASGNAKPKRIDFRFSLGESGKATSPTLLKASVVDSSSKNCLFEALKAIEFPPGAIQTFTYPFVP
ncbi:MAG: hypothetical protein HN348_02345 [Proteobacteria bacterium]|jgi:hypothetical protein|nr:hypothetical protein [Pseudomonadota bacterium]